MVQQQHRQDRNLLSQVSSGGSGSSGSTNTSSEGNDYNNSAALSSPFVNMLQYPPMHDHLLGATPKPVAPPSSGVLGLSTNGSSSPLGPRSLHRHTTYQPTLLPLKESLIAPKQETKPKLDLSMPNFPQKTRKRHKVATSCNRCRQNKRKCDSGIPCSNCKRNKADCLYTDAQQSRSTWGDSPLSQEKVQGVSTADLETDSTSASPPSLPTTASLSSVSSSTSAVAKEPEKSSAKDPSAMSLSKKPSISRAPVAAGVSNVAATSATSAVQTISLHVPTSLFNLGHASSQQDRILDRRKETVAAQSKQIAKAIRVAQPGPQLDLSDLIPTETSVDTAQRILGVKIEPSYSGWTNPTTGSTTQPVLAFHSQSGPRPVFRQDATVGHLSPPPSQQTQLAFQVRQVRQEGLDERTAVLPTPVQPSSPYPDPSKRLLQPSTLLESHDKNQPQLGFSNPSGNHPLSSQQRFPLSYPDSGASNFAGFAPLVPSQGVNYGLASQGFQDGGVSSRSLHLPMYDQRDVSGPTNSGINSAFVQQQQQQQQQQQYNLSPSPVSPQQPYDTTATLNSSAVVSPKYKQQRQQQVSTSPETQLDPNHTISSAAPASSIGVASQFSPIGSWDGSALQPQGQMEWRGSSAPHQSTEYPKQSFVRQPISKQQPPFNFNHVSSQPSVKITPAELTPSSAFTTHRGHSSQHYSPLSVPVSTLQTEDRAETMRMRRIAKDMLDCKNYDYSVLLPRHISQEYDEFWVAPRSTAPNNLQGIPRQLLMLPKDANFLIDVFFENACFYYPIVNRALVEMHLMEPETPQALFLLNIVFMTACKHLARHTDIKRAIQFRERAREIQRYIDGKARLTKLLGRALGSQVIYGVFAIDIGLAQFCGTYRPIPTTDGYEEAESSTDLAAESRSLIANRGVIPESVYQQRLWAFWAHYARDAMARLYFGWPHGLDSMAVFAELPRIKGCVGLGGMRKNLMRQNGLDGAVTGKRRGPAMKKKQVQREKKQMRAKTATIRSGRDMYRMASSTSDDDDDDDDVAEEDDDESDLEQDEFAATGEPSVDMKDESHHADADMGHRRSSGLENSRTNTTSNTLKSTVGGTNWQTKDRTPSFSGLSKHLLERQSRGEDINRRQGGSGPGSGSGSGLGSRSAEVRRHLDRMKVLLEAESDITDGGTYARILFLEEIKLWSIGRRVGLYLQGRNTSLTVSPAAAAMGSYSPNNTRGSTAESNDPFASTISATLEASRCSENAWLEDKELQSLQADLIEWEQALPPIFKFRQDVKQLDINHKLNGKLSVLAMYYYTITIMLQSSYLPIPQHLSSSWRSPAVKTPESISREYDGLFSRCASEDSGPRIKREAESPQLGSNGYFNTAHQICTQLSNVLYHHVELMLDSYPNWCTIQVKVNQTLTAALRVSCLNARLSSNSKTIRDEAKAGFKMGSDLFKRQALLPDPLTVRDWPAEEDVQVMLDLEEEFRELMTTQEEQETPGALGRSRDNSEGFGGYEDPGEHLLYTPDSHDGVAIVNQGFAVDTSLGPRPYGFFRAEHVFGMSEEGFHFDYDINA